MKRLHALSLLLLLGLLSATGVWAAAPATVDEVLGQGSTFRKDQRYEEARSLYEEWLKIHPGDAHVTFELGYSLFLQASAEGANQRGTDLRKRSYQLMRESERLGYSDAMLDLMKGAIDQDGKDLSVFSANPTVDAVMREGEQAFAAGKFDDALKSYGKAIQLDPKAYGPVLFTGDVYFNRNEYAVAMDWFDKATKLDPNIETAYRYWGDALVKVGRLDDALEKYLQAVIAEPYSRLPRQMLQAFATRTSRPFGQPGIKIPNLTITLAGGKASPNQDLKGDPLLTTYLNARAAWLQQEWPKHYGKDSAIRHSLPEEADALRKTARTAVSFSAADRAKLTPWQNSLEAIQALDSAGLLEAYILLDRADDGITHDYAAYREQNRAVLLRYLREITLGGVPPPTGGLAK